MYYKGFPGSSVAKNSPAMQELQEMLFQSLDQEDPLEEGMATYSSILAWGIPMDRVAWRATVCGVAKRWTRLSAWAHPGHRLLSAQAPPLPARLSFPLHSSHLLFSVLSPAGCFSWSFASLPAKRGPRPCKAPAHLRSQLPGPETSSPVTRQPHKLSIRLNCTIPVNCIRTGWRH